MLHGGDYDRSQSHHHGLPGGKIVPGHLNDTVHLMLLLRYQCCCAIAVDCNTSVYRLFTTLVAIVHIAHPAEVGRIGGVGGLGEAEESQKPRQSKP